VLAVTGEVGVGETGDIASTEDDEARHQPVSASPGA
jgi:hypothetical protein